MRLCFTFLLLVEESHFKDVSERLRQFHGTQAQGICVELKLYICIYMLMFWNRNPGFQKYRLHMKRVILKPGVAVDFWSETVYSVYS